ncbi:GNAT family N-acetyltransferase [Thermoplasmatales archaeon ex4484_6]|nr:MAG: GNAT family N-acetyltransferase [Thermoplasmatales archaeon ex4484_6]RLF68415.1 MAG: GNAT family N-acetyltransferase [Thermoplasmata archaeon]
MIPNLEIMKANGGELLGSVHMIREEVFIREQNVPREREYDEFEDESVHFLALMDGKPAGCIRYRLKRACVKIERLAVLRQYRKKRIGRALMKYVESVSIVHSPDEFVLHSQLTAVPFYRKMGYAERGPVFKDAGIDHVEMYKRVDGND